MHEGNHLLDHVNKVKALTVQLVYLESPMKNENIVMTLLENLPVSFEYFITVMETMLMKNLMLMKDLMMDCVTTHLMHEMLKCQKNKPQSENAFMVLRQNKGGNLFPCQGLKSCFYCGKPDYTTCFCYKAKNKK